MEFLEALTGILITTSVFAAIVLSLYFYLRARNQERMAMIEKGYQPKELVFGKNKSLRSLKTGIFFMGVALGIFFGHLIGRYTVINEVVAYFVMILLLGGLALIFTYYIESRIRSSKD
jgi:heme A synthase